MNDDHALLRDALTARLSKTGVQDVWAALGEAGLFGLTVAEADGGMGADLPTAAVVADVLGAHCLPTPFIDSVMATRLMAGANSDSVATVRAALVAGQTIAVCGLEKQLADTLTIEQSGDGARVQGRSRLVPDAASAKYFLMIVEAEGVPGLWIATRGPGVTVTAYPTIDGRLAGDVDFTAAPATLVLTDARDAITAARNDAIALLASEAAALMTSLVRQTADYAKQREQFGQPISKFQAVQHRIVDMHIAARRAGAIARAAVTACGGPASAERDRTISAAKATINETGRFVGQNAVQLHGGMGMTEELPIGRYFKRLTVIETQLGSTSAHVRRYAATMAGA